MLSIQFGVFDCSCAPMSLRPSFSSFKLVTQVLRDGVLNAIQYWVAIVPLVALCLIAPRAGQMQIVPVECVLRLGTLGSSMLYVAERYYAYSGFAVATQAAVHLL